MIRLSDMPSEDAIPADDLCCYVDQTATRFGLVDGRRELFLQKVSLMLGGFGDGLLDVVRAPADGTKHIRFYAFLSDLFCRNVALAAQDIAAGGHAENSAVGLDNHSVAELEPGDESGSGGGPERGLVVRSIWFWQANRYSKIGCVRRTGFGSSLCYWPSALIELIRPTVTLKDNIGSGSGEGAA